MALEYDKKDMIPAIAIYKGNEAPAVLFADRWERTSKYLLGYYFRGTKKMEVYCIPLNSLNLSIIGWNEINRDWFNNIALGKNTLGDFLRNIQKETKVTEE